MEFTPRYSHLKTSSKFMQFFSSIAIADIFERRIFIIFSKPWWDIKKIFVHRKITLKIVSPLLIAHIFWIIRVVCILTHEDFFPLHTRMALNLPKKKTIFKFKMLENKFLLSFFLWFFLCWLWVSKTFILTNFVCVRKKFK